MRFSSQGAVATAMVATVAANPHNGLLGLGSNYGGLDLGKPIHAGIDLNADISNKVLVAGLLSEIILDPLAQVKAGAEVVVVCEDCHIKGEIDASISLEKVVPALSLSLKGVEVLLDLDVYIGAAATIAVNLVAPAKVSLPLPGLNVEALVHLDLVLGVHTELDLSAGVYVSLPEASLETNILSGDILDVDFSGVVVKVLPIKVRIGCTELLADLRLRVDLGLSAAVDVDEIVPLDQLLPGLHIPTIGAGLELAVYANLLEYVGLFCAAPECPLAKESYGLNVGAAVELGVAVEDLLSIHLAPTVATAVLSIPTNTICIPSYTATIPPYTTPGGPGYSSGVPTSSGSIPTGVPTSSGPGSVPTSSGSGSGSSSTGVPTSSGPGSSSGVSSSESGSPTGVPTSSAPGSPTGAPTSSGAGSSSGVPSSSDNTGVPTSSDNGSSGVPTSSGSVPTGVPTSSGSGSSGSVTGVPTSSGSGSVPTSSGSGSGSGSSGVSTSSGAAPTGSSSGAVTSPAGPATTSAPGGNDGSVTSTVTNTATYTVTACAVNVPNCPAGYQTSVTVVHTTSYTTVCPATATGSITAAYPAPTSTGHSIETITKQVTTMVPCDSTTTFVPPTSISAVPYPSDVPTHVPGYSAGPTSSSPAGGNSGSVPTGYPTLSYPAGGSVPSSSASYPGHEASYPVGTPSASYPAGGSSASSPAGTPSASYPAGGASVSYPVGGSSSAGYPTPTGIPYPTGPAPPSGGNGTTPQTWATYQPSASATVPAGYPTSTPPATAGAGKVGSSIAAVVALMGAVMAL
ncbi:hypothetical protein F4860DRAFT_526948 [Xylaria cubensis]|nr:hypothetical protein F4860DRAFT_526948 [Xylaria cubensis]